MRHFISLLFSLFIFSFGFSQGFESFDHFPETGNSYQSGNFTGDEGFTWHYEKARGDIEIDGKALTLGRNQSPAAELYSESFSGGVGVLEFQFMQAFSTNVNLQVYINGELVYTATSSGEQNEIKDASVTVDVEGDIVLRFANPSGAGQVTIDNINWTGYEESGGGLEYCENEAFITEPITHVEFAGINNPSPNDFNAPGYEDFTHIHASVETESSYTISLQGNTDGTYTNYFTVWIDWNQNGIFEENEKTQAGSIQGSTGDDGQTATGIVTVPADALLGTTRMRIIKNFGAPLADACGSFTFGQVEDYSVDVSEGDGEGEYTGDCYVKYNSSRIDGVGDVSTLILAADFPVEAGDVLDIYYLNFMLVGDVSGVELSIYEDGGNGPGAEILAPILLTPVSQTSLGDSQVDTPLFDIRLDVSSLNISLEGGANGSTYWVAIQTLAGSFQSNWWAFSCEINNGTPLYGSLDGYGSWVSLTDYDFNVDGAFSINCPPDEEWSESCNYDCEEQFVDPQDDGGNLIVGGSVNQMLAFDIPVAENDFAFDGIEMNLYFSSGDGSDSPYEFTLYEDDNGGPGTVIQTWEVSGADESIQSGDFYRVTVSFPAVELEADTIYWMSVDSNADAWETINYTPLNKPVAFINNNTEGEWVVQSSEDLVYALICYTEIPSTPSDDCGPDYESQLEGGLGDLADGIILAADFPVDPFISLNVNTVRIPIIDTVESIEISFYEDDNGSPGTEALAPTDIIPVNQTLVAVNSIGDYIYEMELDMTSFELSLDGGAEGAIYWMGIATTGDNENFWSYSTTINNGTYFAGSLDNYQTWIDTGGAGFPYDGAFSINCEGLPEIEEPGCEPSVSFVEPITRVVIGEDLSNPAMPVILDNSSAPDSTDPVEDFTHISIDFIVGGPYDIGVEGNTDGPYTNYFTAFVDLSDGEWSDYVTFEIGSIQNSTGTDGQMAVGEISLNDYVSENGDYPMRVIKSYGSSPLDPCAHYSFGQVENYMLTVTVNVPGDDFPDPYCDWEVIEDVEPITYVQFAGIDNESDPIVNGSPALEDFTHIEGTVEQGGTYEIGVNGNTNGNWQNHFAVYIDWNQDGDFDDPGEEYQIGTITNSDGSGGPILFGDISVPADALIGQTRMRVIKRFDPITEACDGAWWGQAEDYTLNITEGDGGGQNPDDCDQGDVSNPAGVDNGFGITLGDIYDVADDFFVTGSTLDIKMIKLNLLAAGLIDQVDIAFYEDDGGLPGTLMTQSVSAAITPEQQVLVNTAFGFNVYEVYIPVDLNFITGHYWMAPHASYVGGGSSVYWEQTSAGSLGDPTAVRNITQGEEWNVNDDLYQSVFTLYCEEVDVPEEPELPCNFTINFDVEPITRVITAGIDNMSDATVNGSPELEDFTDIEGNVEAGESYSVALEGNTNGSFTNYFTVFIKWNEGDSWSDYSTFEIGSINSSTGTDGQQAVGTIDIPADAAEGAYIMRVVKNFGTSPTDPCGTYGWGQAEDYTLIMGDGGMGTGELSEFDFSYYPNPVRDRLYINSAKNIENVRVFNLTRQEILSNSKVSNGQIDVSALPKGVYVFRVMLEGGQVETFKIIKN